MKEVIWCGFDYGQTLMDPTHIRVKVLMACVFIDLEVDRPGVVDEKASKYYALKEKYGSFPRLKEAGRHEIYSEILEDDPRSIRIYDETELKLLKPSEGLRPALRFLKEKGLSLNVVSDVSSGKGLEIIVRFLNLYDLRAYFTELITGLGRIREDGSLDESYKGLSKKTGTMYDKLQQDLERKGISPPQAVIIGDHPDTDIRQPKMRGFKTIGYTGFTRVSTPEADYEISHFRQIHNLFGGA